MAAAKEHEQLDIAALLAANMRNGPQIVDFSQIDSLPQERRSSQSRGEYAPQPGDTILHVPSTISAEDLWEQFISKRKPVVIDGFPTDPDWQAHKWSNLEHLRQLAGHAPVKIEPIHPSFGHFGTGTTRRRTTFGEFLDVLEDPAEVGKWYLTTQYESDSDGEGADGEDDTSNDDDDDDDDDESMGEEEMLVLMTANSEGAVGDNSAPLIAETVLSSSRKRKRDSESEPSSDDEDADEGREPSLEDHETAAADDDEEKLSLVLSDSEEEPDLDDILPSPTHALVTEFPAQPKLMGGLVLQQCNLWLGSSGAPANPQTTTSAGANGTSGPKSPAPTTLPGKSSGLHHDFHDNLYALLAGRKRLLLFPPQAHRFLHPRGNVLRVHKNGLIIYEPREHEIDRAVALDLLQSDAANGRELPDPELVEFFRSSQIAVGRARNGSIRADGLTPLDAARWRIRARARALADANERAAVAAGEDRVRKERRKGKARQTREQEAALLSYHQAKREYVLQKLIEEESQVEEDEDLESIEGEGHWSPVRPEDFGDISAEFRRYGGGDDDEDMPSDLENGFFDLEMPFDASELMDTDPQEGLEEEDDDESDDSSSSADSVDLMEDLFNQQKTAIVQARNEAQTEEERELQTKRLQILVQRRQKFLEDREAKMLAQFAEQMAAQEGQGGDLVVDFGAMDQEDDDEEEEEGDEDEFGDDEIAVPKNRKERRAARKQQRLGKKKTTPKKAVMDDDVDIGGGAEDDNGEERGDADEEEEPEGWMMFDDLEKEKRAREDEEAEDDEESGSDEEAGSEEPDLDDDEDDSDSDVDEDEDDDGDSEEAPKPNDDPPPTDSAKPNGRPSKLAVKVKIPPRRKQAQAEAARAAAKTNGLVDYSDGEGDEGDAKSAVGGRKVAGAAGEGETELERALRLNGVDDSTLAQPTKAGAAKGAANESDEGDDAELDFFGGGVSAQDDDDDEEDSEEDDGEALFEKAEGSDESDFDLDAVDDGEAMLAALAKQADALEADGGAGRRKGGGHHSDEEDDSVVDDSKEPSSFSLIKPHVLHAFYGLGGGDGSPSAAENSAANAASTSGTNGSKNDKKGKNKPGKNGSGGGKDAIFDGELLPRPGCPQPLVVDLEPGQCLYLPASWWHEVTSMSTPEHPFHCALNFWFHPPTNLSNPPPTAAKGGKQDKLAKDRGPDRETGAGAGSGAGAAAGSANAASSGPAPPSAQNPYEDAEVWDEVRRTVAKVVRGARREAEARAQSNGSGSRSSNGNGNGVSQAKNGGGVRREHTQVKTKKECAGSAKRRRAD